jgi:hypothetical protein
MNLGWSGLRATRERGAANGPSSAASGAVSAPCRSWTFTGLGTVSVRAGDERIPGGRRSRRGALKTGGTRVSGDSSRAPLKDKREEKE